MVILSSPTGFFEILIFASAIVAFVLAVRFFVDSRKRLEELFPGIVNPGKLLPFDIDRSGFLIPKTVNKAAANKPSYQPANNSSDSTKDEIRDLRTQFQQQQQELSKALEQISLLGQRE